jgi:hypothetical protein
MKKLLFLLVIVFFITSCSEDNTPEIVPIDNSFNANISGTIKYTNDSEASKNNINIREWVLNEDSKVEVKISKNLTSNPYNIKLTINVDENNPEAPVLNFISDFDRKIIAGDRFRLITSIILHGSASFIPGTTGGQILYNNTLSPYGFGFGSELEINIASTGNTILNDSAQYIILSGTFVFDNNNGSGIEIGTFEIYIDGNNIIDTSIF